MKKKVLAILFTMILCITISVPAFAEETTTTSDNITTIQSSIDDIIISPQTIDVGYINANGVRLRSSAGLSGTIIALLYSGDSVALSETTQVKDGYTWRLIEVDRIGKSGWVVDSYITRNPV